MAEATAAATLLVSFAAQAMRILPGFTVCPLQLFYHGKNDTFMVLRITGPYAEGLPRRRSIHDLSR